MSIHSGHPLHSQIRARDGATCIYAEKDWIALARMSIGSLTDTLLELSFTAFSTPGFTPPDGLTWEAGVALTEFRSPAMSGWGRGIWPGLLPLIRKWSPH